MLFVVRLRLVSVPLRFPSRIRNQRSQTETATRGGDGATNDGGGRYDGARRAFCARCLVFLEAPSLVLAYT